jgi:hypothetical protein
MALNDEKIKLGKDFFIIAVLTLIATLTWIGLEVYWTWQKNTISTPTQAQMKTLSPVINKDIFNQLEQKVDPTVDQITETISANPPKITITPGKEASKNGTLKTTQNKTIATESSSLNQ